jgi:hypothetical protein
MPTKKRIKELTCLKNARRDSPKKRGPESTWQHFEKLEPEPKKSKGITKVVAGVAIPTWVTFPTLSDIPDS